MNKNSITIVTLGPGDERYLTFKTVEQLKSKTLLFLRTARHPITKWLDQNKIPYSSFDAFYESAEQFDELNERIVNELCEKCKNHPVTYAVPNALNDESVKLLKKKAKNNEVYLKVLPGVTDTDIYLCASEIPDHENGFHILSAISFLQAPYNPDVSCLLSEVDSEIIAGEVKIKLGEYHDDFFPVYCFSSMGNHREVPTCIPLYQLDRLHKYDHTTAFFIPGTPYTMRTRFVFNDLVSIMSRLRANDGCPWDKIQTHESLRPYLIEEAWETVDAIDQENTEQLADELGDVLLQVVFHASIGASFDEFTLEDIITNICQKMIRRHPFLFKESSGIMDKGQSWETIKRMENGVKTIGESLEDVSPSLPALKYAIKINKKLGQLSASRKTARQIAELMQHLAKDVLSPDGRSIQENVIGELLIACMELCRLFDADGEIILHKAVNKAKERYQRAEKLILSDGKKPEKLTSDELDNYLESVKTPE